MSGDITGQVIESSGRILGIAQGWIRGPHITKPPVDPLEVDEIVRELLSQATPRTKLRG
jgi:hypothetical protein